VARVVGRRGGRAEFTTALDHDHQALILDEHHADLWAQAKTHNHLGFIRARMGHHVEALHYQRLAVHCYQEEGDDSGLAWLTLDSATPTSTTVSPTSAACGSPAHCTSPSRSETAGGEIHAPTGLGFTREETGRPLLERALELARAVGDRWSECLAPTGTGVYDRLAGAMASALDRLRQPH
jgi:hypothetical protein